MPGCHEGSGCLQLCRLESFDTASRLDHAGGISSLGAAQVPCYELGFHFDHEYDLDSDGAALSFVLLVRAADVWGSITLRILCCWLLVPVVRSVVAVALVVQVEPQGSGRSLPGSQIRCSCAADGRQRCTYAVRSGVVTLGSGRSNGWKLP